MSLEKSCPDGHSACGCNCDLNGGASLTLSVPEAGALLGLGRNSAYEAAKKGELPVLKFGKLLRVPRAALESMLNKAASKE